MGYILKASFTATGRERWTEPAEKLEGDGWIKTTMSEKEIELACGHWIDRYDMRLDVNRKPRYRDGLRIYFCYPCREAALPAADD